MNTLPKFSFLASPSLPGRLRVGVFLALTVLVSTSIMTYITFNDAVNEVEDVVHSNKVKIELEVIMSSLKDAETGVRGFLLTEDSSFLEPFTNSYKETNASYKKLKELVKDNSKQQKKIEALSVLINSRYLYLDSALYFYAKNENKKEVFLSRFRAGKTVMNNAREVVQEMRFEEDLILKLRAQQSYSSIRKSQVVIIIFLVTSIIIIGLSFYLLLKFVKVIQEKEKTYRNIFEYSHDLLCICKSDFTVIECNPRFTHTFGFEKDATRAIFPHYFFSDANDAEFIKENISKGINVQQKELTFTGAQGELHVCLGSFILIDKVHKIYSIVLTDITDKIQLQREREAMERFANIGKVSRVLAHEVRNPLTNINLAVEGLYDENKEESLKDYFGIIQRNSARINKLITELLNSTRPTVLNIGDVDINALLEESLLLAKDRIGLQHITIQKEFADNLPTINGDFDKLGIAFLNIIINAIEAMPKENGLLQITTKLTKNLDVNTLITDNGSGMDTETIEEIFQPFFTKKSNGTGLGLASTQNIILTHKGKIEVKSIVGKGTTFTICLPS